MNRLLPLASSLVLACQNKGFEDPSFEDLLSAEDLVDEGWSDSRPDHDGEALVLDRAEVTDLCRIAYDCGTDETCLNITGRSEQLGDAMSNAEDVHYARLQLHHLPPTNVFVPSVGLIEDIIVDQWTLHFFHPDEGSIGHCLVFDGVTESEDRRLNILQLSDDLEGADTWMHAEGPYSTVSDTNIALAMDLHGRLHEKAYDHFLDHSVPTDTGFVVPMWFE